jgi:2-dehydropantoate 2-reductase
MAAKEGRILVVGAGAVGGVAAVFMAASGAPVEVLVRRSETAALIRSEGLRVRGVKGGKKAVLPAYSAPGEVPGQAGLIFLATKATALPGVVNDILPLLAPGGLIVSLQNGMTAETVASIAGPEAAAGCVVGWGATMHGPADLEMTSAGEFIVGRLDGRNDPRLERVRGLLETIVPAVVSGHIRGHLYAKMIINACITSLGALSGLRLGPQLASPAARALFVGIIREAMAVACASGLKVEPLLKLDFDKFLRGDGRLDRLRRTAMIRLIGLKYRRLKSSSLQSLERGEKTEVDALNGDIAARGRAVGVPVPINARLTEMVHEIEAGSRPIRPTNIDELASIIGKA